MPVSVGPSHCDRELKPLVGACASTWSRAAESEAEVQFVEVAHRDPPSVSGLIVKLASAANTYGVVLLQPWFFVMAVPVVSELSMNVARAAAQ